MGIDSLALFSVLLFTKSVGSIEPPMTPYFENNTNFNLNHFRINYRYENDSQVLRLYLTDSLIDLPYTPKELLNLEFLTTVNNADSSTNSQDYETLKSIQEAYIEQHLVLESTILTYVLIELIETSVEDLEHVKIRKKIAEFDGLLQSFGNEIPLAMKNKCYEWLLVLNKNLENYYSSIFYSSLFINTEKRLLNRPYRMARAYKIIGESYFELNQQTLAQAYLSISDSILTSKKLSPGMQMVVSMGQAMALFHKENKKLSKAYMQRASTAIEELSDTLTDLNIINSQIAILGNKEIIDTNRIARIVQIGSRLINSWSEEQVVSGRHSILNFFKLKYSLEGMSWTEWMDEVIKIEKLLQENGYGHTSECLRLRNYLSTYELRNNSDTSGAISYLFQGMNRCRGYSIGEEVNYSGYQSWKHEIINKNEMLRYSSALALLFNQIGGAKLKTDTGLFYIKMAWQQYKSCIGMIEDYLMDITSKRDFVNFIEGYFYVIENFIICSSILTQNDTEIDDSEKAMIYKGEWEAIQLIKTFNRMSLEVKNLLGNVESGTAKDIARYKTALAQKVKCENLLMEIDEDSMKFNEQTYDQELRKFARLHTKEQKMLLRFGQSEMLELIKQKSALEDFVEEIPENLSFVEMFSGRNCLAIIVLSKGNLWSYSVYNADSLKRYYDAVGRIQDWVMKRESNPRSELNQQVYDDLYFLYNRFFQRLESKGKLRQNIIIAPQKTFGMFPFEILLTKRVNLNQSEDLRWMNMPFLFKEHNVHYSHSNQLWRVHRKNSSNVKTLDEIKVGVFDAIDFSQNDSFSSSPIDNRYSLNIWSGSNCTKEAFRENASKFDVLYLNTHAVGIDSLEKWPLLYFREESTNDQVVWDPIAVHEIYQLDLKNELVILKACETGKGNYVYGNGIYSISEIFGQIGSKHLVSSIWQISNSQYDELMKLYFEELSKGEGKGVALTIAKRKYLDLHDQHPFFWAGMVYFGDDTPLVKKERFPYNYLWVLGVLGSGLLLYRNRKRLRRSKRKAA